MPLQTGLIRIPLGRGLAQGEDERLVVPGSMGEANNVIVDRVGRYTPRPGWGQLSATSEDGSAMPDPDRVDVAGLELLQVDREQGALWSYGPGRDRWERIGYLPPLSVERRPMVRTQTSLITGGIVRFGADDRYELRMWQYLASGGGGGTFETYYRLHDSETGAMISRDSQVYTPARLTVPVLVKVGTSAWVVYAATDVRAFRVKPDLTSATTVVDAEDLLYKFDACASIDGSEALIATIPLGLDRIRVFRLAEDGSIVTSSFFTDGVTDTPSEVSICARSGDGLWVAAVLGFPTNDLLVWRLDSDLALVAGPITVVSEWDEIGWPSLGTDANGDLWVAWTGRENVDQQRAVHVRRIFTATDALDATVARTLYRATSGMAPQLLDDGLYLPVLASPIDFYVYSPADGDDDPLRGGDQHLALIRLDADAPTDPPTFAGLLVRNVCSIYTTQQRWSALADNTYQIATVVRTRATPSNLTDGVDVLTLDPRGRRQAQGAQLAQQHVWALAGLWGYDGFDCHEEGFIQAPEILSATPGTSGAGAAWAAGTVAYRGRYECLDDRGVLHVSPWSRDFLVEVDGATHNSVGLVMMNTGFTAHGRRAVYRSISIAVYRSKVNGAAGGVTRYYRLTPYGAPVAQLNVATTSYSDLATDDDIEALGYGTEVSSGGRLPYEVPPPARAVVATKRRCWLASGEDNRSIWFSQQILDGETPWWAEELSVQLLDTDERIEALAPLDDAVVGFTRSRIYAISDDGPSDTGDGAFAGPTPINTSFGCIDRGSVLATTRGIYFRSASGICLLDRGLSVSVVGDPIRDLFDDPAVEIRHAVYDEANARAIFHLFTAGIDVGQPSTLAIYDERHAVWTTATSDEVDEVYSLAYDRNARALVVCGKFHVYREGALGFDGTEADPVWFDKTIGTPWLRGGELGSWAQVRLVHLEGEAQGPCTVQLDAYYDYATSNPKSVELDFTAEPRGTQIVKQLGLPQQTFRALRLVLHEVGPESAPADLDAPNGVRWWGLALDATVVPGPARIAATDRGGLSLWHGERCWVRAWARWPVGCWAAPWALAWACRRVAPSVARSRAPSTTPRPSRRPTSTRRCTTRAGTTRSAPMPARPRPQRPSARAPRPTGASTTRAATCAWMCAGGRWAWPTSSTPTCGGTRPPWPSCRRAGRSWRRPTSCNSRPPTPAAGPGRRWPPTGRP